MQERSSVFEDCNVNNLLSTINSRQAKLSLPMFRLEVCVNVMTCITRGDVLYVRCGCLLVDL